MADLKEYQVVMPKLGLIMDKAKLVDWHRNEGEWIEKGEVLFTLESEKSTLEIESPASGYVHILVSAGITAPVMTPLAVISSKNKTVAPSLDSDVLGVELQSGNERVLVSNQEQAAEGQIIHPIRATPKVRRTARQKGISLECIIGSGPRGMIVSDDLQMDATIDEPAINTPVPRKLTGLRAVIADRLTAGWQERPQATLVMEVDATNLVRTWKQIAEEKKRKVSYNSFIMMAVAHALKNHQNINVSLTEHGLVQFEEISIGIAVDTERGLIVPVIRNVDRMDLFAVDKEMRDLAERALAGNVMPDELSGGTFTITNLGAYGIDLFSPIINPPQAAILGVGRISPRAVVSEGRLIARETVNLSLAFDHRIVDGGPAALFLQHVAQLIESTTINTQYLNYLDRRQI